MKAARSLIVVAAWLASSSAVAAPTTKSICEFLVRSDGTTDDAAIAAALDELRALGKDAEPAAETLSSLLPHRSRLYRDRDKVQVVRLRAHLLVTLSEIGVPASAMPALFDTLANVDERMSPLEIAAAARAAAALGSGGHGFAPYLLDALALRLSPEEVSLERYEQEFPPSEATTAQLELVRALARISSSNDRDVVDALRRLSTIGHGDQYDPRLPQEAALALEAIEGGGR